MKIKYSLRKRIAALEMQVQEQQKVIDKVERHARQLESVYENLLDLINFFPPRTHKQDETK